MTEVPHNPTQTTRGTIRLSLANLVRVTVGPAMFILVVAGLAVLTELAVRFVMLASVYGVAPVADGTIYFVSTKPDLIVSNGDKLNTPSFVHWLAIGVPWLSSCLTLAYLLRRPLAWFQLDRRET